MVALPPAARWQPRLGVLALLLPLALLAAGEPVDRAAAAVSSESVAVLRMLNLLRTDHRIGESPILRAIHEHKLPANDWSAQPGKNSRADQAPVVLSPYLALVARSLLQRGAQPPAGKKPFDAKDGMSEAGYPAAEAGGVALFGLHATDLPHALALACLNVTGTYAGPTGHVYDVYGIEEIYRPAWREVGIALGGGKETSVVLVFGQGSAKRQLGGVVYQDANHNGRYDADEGIPGVAIARGALAMSTGPSGIWWLADDSLEAQPVAFTHGGSKATRTVPSQAGTAWCEWSMPIPDDAKAVGKLLGEAQEARKSGDDKRQRQAVAALLVGAQRRSLDDDLRKQVDEATATLLPEFTALREGLLSRLAEDKAAYGKYLTEQKRDWGSAISQWFKEAQLLGTLRLEVLAILAESTPPNGKRIAAIRSALDKAKNASVDPAFHVLYETWDDQLAQHVRDSAIAPAP